MDCVDLFCGCGGLSLGFMKAGHRILAAFDNWDAALEVYRRNFTHEAVKMDLGDVETSHHRENAGQPAPGGTTDRGGTSIPL